MHNIIKKNYKKKLPNCIQKYCGKKTILRKCNVFQKGEEYVILKHIDYNLLFHILGNFALLQAGQKILNETSTLNNALARLYNIIQLGKL